MADWQSLPICGFTDNYFWALHNADDSRVALVDPGDAAPVLAWLDNHNLQLAAILVTHHHADHIGGIEQLTKHYPTLTVFAPHDNRIPCAAIRVAEGDTVRLDFLPASFSVYEYPGHTSSHIGYYTESAVGEVSRLFCGDTVFACGCGRLFEGSPQQMHASLTKVKQLPDHTEIYCAHEYTLDNIDFAKWVEPENKYLLQREQQARLMRQQDIATVPSLLEEENLTNPFLRFSIPSVRFAAEKHYSVSLPTEVEVFAAVRRWKDTEFD